MASEEAINPNYSGIKGVLPIEVPGYEIKERLSRDSAFTIYRGQRSQDLAPVLLKVINQLNPTPVQLAPLWQEFETLRILDIPGVEKAYTLENEQQ